MTVQNYQIRVSQRNCNSAAKWRTNNFNQVLKQVYTEMIRNVIITKLFFSSILVNEFRKKFDNIAAKFRLLGPFLDYIFFCCIAHLHLLMFLCPFHGRFYLL